MKKQLLILMTICASSLAHSQSVGDTFVDSFITYEITSLTPNRVEVTDYNSAGGTDVTIPNSVTPNSSGRVSSSDNINNRMMTYSVTSIGSQAFFNNQIESVFIPIGVTQIGTGAFQNNNLREITIPSNVTSIGSSAFLFNEALTCIISQNPNPPAITTSSAVDTFGERFKKNLMVPSGSLPAYTSSSGGWQGFNNNGQPLSNNDTFWDGYFRYQITSITNNTVSLIDYNFNGGSSAIIPATVSDCNSTYTVLEIGVNAFLDNNFNITSVSLPNTITTINNNAFSSSELTSLILPDSVLTIGQGAFANNNIAGTLVIPSGVTTIGDYAFRGNQFSNLTISETVTSIGSTAFDANPNLSNVYSFATTPPAISTGGSNFDTFGNRSNIHLHIPAGTMDVYVTNPGALWTGFNPVSEIFVDSFITYEITSLTPNAVKAIDYNPDGGTSVVIPNTVTHSSITYTVTKIDEFAFSTNSLDNVSIANSVTSIEQYAFASNNLTDVTIPDSVTDMGVSVFRDNQLQMVTISNGLTSIAAEAFENNLISTVTIPDGVTTIFHEAFRNNKLTTITFPTSVTSIYTGAFKDNLLTDIQFSNNITAIDNESFLNNQLAVINLPSSLNFIGVRAFLNNSLTDIYSSATSAPTIYTTGSLDTFGFTERANINLHIPTGSTGSYVTDTGALWTGFNTVTEDPTLSSIGFEMANDIRVITTTDEIKVIASNAIRLQNYSLYSITGAKVSQGKESKISTASFANGIYILKLDFDKGTLVKKIVK